MKGWSCARVREVSGLWRWVGREMGGQVTAEEGWAQTGTRGPWGAGGGGWPWGSPEGARSRPGRRRSGTPEEEGPAVTVVGGRSGLEQGAERRAAGWEGLLSVCLSVPGGGRCVWGIGDQLPFWSRALASLRESWQSRGIGALGAVALGVGGGLGAWGSGGGLLGAQGTGEGSQVQAALRLSRRPAPTAVALGRVPTSGLKSAPPAQACPGTWQRGAGINTGKLEGLPELTRSLQLEAQRMRERFVLSSRVSQDCWEAGGRVVGGWSRGPGGLASQTASLDSPRTRV